MRILVLAAAATVMSGCSYIDQQGAYGVSHISPYATTGVYAGCGTSTYTAANDCGSASYYGQAQYDYGQQPANCGTTCDTGYNYSQSQYNQGYDQNSYHNTQAYSDCASPCNTGYYAPQQTATTSYAVSHGTPVHYGTTHHGLRGAHSYGHQRNRGYAYGELGARAQFGIENVDPVFDAVGRLGYQSPNILGVEIEGAKGVMGSDVLFDAGMGPEAADFKMDTSMAAFAVARMPFGQVDGFIRGGYHETKYTVEVDSSGAKFEAKDRGFAVGGGLEVPLSHNGALRADVTYYDNGSVGNEDAWTTGMTYQHRF